MDKLSLSWMNEWKNGDDHIVTKIPEILIINFELCWKPVPIPGIHIEYEQSAQERCNF